MAVLAFPLEAILALKLFRVEGGSGDRRVPPYGEMVLSRIQRCALSSGMAPPAVARRANLR